MKFEFSGDDLRPTAEPVPGMVYACRGGRAASLGHMKVLLAITESAPYVGRSCLFLVIDREGNPTNVSRDAYHIVEQHCPIGYAEGVAEFVSLVRGS